MFFLAAMMWFGFHCGAGFASGVQVKIFAAKYGSIGLLVPFLAWIFNCVYMSIGLEYSRLIKAKSYKDVASTLYSENPTVGKVGVFIWDVLIFMSSITILGSCVAGAGAQLKQIFGLHYAIGCGLFVILMVLILCFGKEIMRRLGKVSIPLIVMFSLVCIVGIYDGYPHMVEVLTTSAGAPMMKNFTMSMLVQSAFTYALIQLGSFQALTVMAGQFESRKETVKFIALGFAMNCGAMLLSCLSLYGYYPDILIAKNTLPTLSIVQKFTGPTYIILMLMYNLVLILAYVTTAGGMAAGAEARYLPLFKKHISNEFTCRVLIIIMFFGIATLLSSLGIDAIIGTVNNSNFAYRKL